MSYTTIQTPDQLRENVGLLKRMMGAETRINIIPEEGMTPQQLGECRHNAAAFDQYLRSKHMTENGADYPIANLRSCYMFLRDNGLLQFEVAPKVNKSSHIMTDDRGRVIKDLRQDRIDAAKRQAEESQQPRKTMEGEMKKAQKNAETNRAIEEARVMIASYRGRYHSDTFKFREAAQAVLDAAMQKDRSLGSILSAISEIKTLSHKYYRD